jgi:hypothetical protein
MMRNSLPMVITGRHAPLALAYAELSQLV